MRQTTEQFHDAAMIAAMQAIVTKSPHVPPFTITVAEGDDIANSVAGGAAIYATALLAHRLPDPAPAHPAQPEQRERWFKSKLFKGLEWKFGGQHGAQGSFFNNGIRAGDSSYSAEVLAGNGLNIELSPATGLPLEQDKPQRDAREVVGACARSIQDLLNIIHDDLTHERQRDHAEAMGLADAALDRACEFLK